MKKVVLVLDEGNSVTRQFTVETPNYEPPLIKSLIDKRDMGFKSQKDVNSIANWPGEQYSVVSVSEQQITIIVVLEQSNLLTRRHNAGLPIMPVEYYQNLFG
jgi:hypothetical protein